MIWDDHHSRCIGGELSSRSEVKAVCLRRDRVVVWSWHSASTCTSCTGSRACICWSASTPSRTTPASSLCADASNMVLACPGVSRGHVNVELCDLRRFTLIPAHESELAQVRSGVYLVFCRYRRKPRVPIRVLREFSVSSLTVRPQKPIHIILIVPGIVYYFQNAKLG